MKYFKKVAVFLVTFTVGFSSMEGVFAKDADESLAADTEIAAEIGDDVVISSSDKPYLALGENLSDEQRKKVLDLMGIDEKNLSDYDVVYVNNKEEHEYLDSYISSSEIGTKSLSSVVITQADKGAGLSISAYNIDYCTIGMYKNACATAGVEDAKIIIAGPFPLSGTAALVGIFKAYQEMTGEQIHEDVMDAAMDELVTTGELNQSIDADPQQVEALIADLKSQLNSLDSDADIKEAILKTAEEYNIELTDDEMAQITSLLQKLKGVDVDWDSIKKQASEWTDVIKDLDIDTEGLWDKVCNFLKSLIDAIKNLIN